MAKKKPARRSKTEPSDDGSVDFEAALSEVEDVVRQLESGELGLSESLSQYERGIEKIKLCHQVLQKAEKRIAVLTGVTEDGTALVEPVDTGDEEQATPDSPPKKRAGRASKSSRPPVGDVDDQEGLF